MTELLQLPDLPDGIRTLTDAESDWLRANNANIPSSVKRCVTCGGSRRFRWWAGTGPDREIRDYECPCEEQLVLHRYLAYSGIEKAYQRLGWADLVGCDPAAGNEVVSWLGHADAYLRSGLGLILLGNQGTGKTLLSQLAFKRLLAEGFEGWAISFHSIVGNLIDSWKSAEAKQEFYSRCLNAPILVVDDLGKELQKERMVKGQGTTRVTQVTAEFAIDMILRHRAAAALPTIITTNFSLAQIGTHYGDSISSLISGSFMEVHFSGGDFRAEARARVIDEGRQGLSRPLVIA